ncbi:transglycosylase SLT domain-containing protein [Legionella sp. CNM-4043-24]|uniref:transglycosylase SLT domain-containing protein n=1 Tax=Legionella sp. CNM-4043-24 TaxID=3421646 RepID=UPI00403AB734
MKTVLIILGIVWFSINAEASTGTDYYERFMAYSHWNENLPVDASDEAFLAFISSDSPLSNKLRDKWLYQLARQKDWANYKKWYRHSNDLNLQCFYHRADFYLGQPELALKEARRLWLSGDTLPVACDVLFSMLRQSSDFDEKLITQRISLALEKQNLPLAHQLLMQYKKPRVKEAQLLTLASQSPSRVTKIGPGELHSEFYLYGMKRLVSINMDRALDFWKLPHTQKMLNTAQKQAFLAQVALYKAMRNTDDAEEWFARVKPAYYNDTLLDWQIRYALKREQWKRVIKLIALSNDKDSPCWQYWLARAQEATEQKESATLIYQNLAKNRNYYGFLASMRLHSKPSFENENISTNTALLRPYQPITNNIKTLYNSNQSTQASRLLNDFMLELPKEHKSALIYWLASKLQWHGKSVYLSNNPELANQLSLRFPLTYIAIVNAHAKNYRIPKEFIYAIIRQESGFREDVVSPAGARGLMQLMPSTANLVAKKEKIQYKDKAQLFSSEKNINIGVAYLQHLSKRFHNHPLLIAAAYNAGPRQAVNWMKNQSSGDIDVWIETLPWRETRNYLKNIMAFYVVYQYRLNQKPDFSAFMKPL